MENYIAKAQVNDVEYSIKDNEARNAIGNITDLDTKNKDSLVEAINEIKADGAGIKTITQEEYDKLSDKTGTYAITDAGNVITVGEVNEKINELNRIIEELRKEIGVSGDLGKMPFYFSNSGSINSWGYPPANIKAFDMLDFFMTNNSNVYTIKKPCRIYLSFTAYFNQGTSFVKGKIIKNDTIIASRTADADGNFYYSGWIDFKEGDTFQIQTAGVSCSWSAQIYFYGLSNEE